MRNAPHRNRVANWLLVAGCLVFVGWPLSYIAVLSADRNALIPPSLRPTYTRFYTLVDAVFWEMRDRHGPRDNRQQPPSEPGGERR